MPPAPPPPRPAPRPPRPGRPGARAARGQHVRRRRHQRLRRPGRAMPESTFALDVDTGSYRVAQALLAEGCRPPAGVDPRRGVGQRARRTTTRRRPRPTSASARRPALAPSLDDGTQLVRVGGDRPRAGRRATGRRSTSPWSSTAPAAWTSATGSGWCSRRWRCSPIAARRRHGLGRRRSTTQARPILEPTPVRRDRRRSWPRSTSCTRAAAPTSRPGLAARLRAGARGVPRGRASTSSCSCSDGVANVGVTGPGSITDEIAEEGARGHPPGHGRLRHGQLQRPPDGAARRPRRRLLLLRRHLRRGRAALRRPSSTTALTPGRRRGPRPGGVRPGAGDVVPAGRLRQPGDRRRRRSRTSPSTPASSAPATTRPRSTRCGWPTASSPARRSAPPTVRWTPPSTAAAGTRRGAGAGRRPRGDADATRSRWPPRSPTSPSCSRARRRPPTRGSRRWPTSAERAAALAAPTCRGAAGPGRRHGAELCRQTEPLSSWLYKSYGLVKFDDRARMATHDRQQHRPRRARPSSGGPEALPVADRSGGAVAGLHRLRRCGR